jgi:hypothetical protein
MKQQLFWLAVLTILSSQCSSPAPSKEAQLPDSGFKKGLIKIPDSWIEKLRKNRYQKGSTSNLTILKEFEGYISPDTLQGTSESTHYEGGVLDENEPGGRYNVLFVNLDEDPDEEIIGTFGYARRDPSLCVFKRINEIWYLLYLEPFFLFKDDPELQIANNYAVNKVFYIRKLQQRGSEIYLDSYRFYKLINGKVYPCLELVNEAFIYGWGLTLNQITSSKFSFNCATADELWVSYTYSFFAGAVEKGDMPWDAHEDITFARGEQGITYEWNNRSKTYQMHPDTIPDGMDAFRLTTDKVGCFGAFGNDTLFVRAFAHELKETLTKGDKRQKKYLNRYLAEVQSTKKSAVPSGELEKKSQVGGTTFYGPKKE